jgi:23S rRNA-/tRNA-specific pseudouridylate synthase
MDRSRRGEENQAQGTAGHSPIAGRTALPARLPAAAILAAGRGWLAVDKPAGVSIHNAPGADLVSLARNTLSADAALRSRIDWRPARSIHPVNRLDRDTSGVVLLACREDALRLLAAQFADGKVVKRYIALLEGRLAAAGTPWGLWDWALNARAAGAGQPRGAPPRVACCTRWRFLGSHAGRTLIVCEPLTGRTHQIRRHARLAGHPVVGDRRYGPRHGASGRLALHALALALTPPGEAAPVVIRSPTIPEDLLQLFRGGAFPPAPFPQIDFIPLALEEMPS